MKKVAFFIATLVTISTFTSCKDKQTETETLQEHKDLAVADTSVKTDSYYYVTAPSGLTLREYNNLNSEKMAIMPYGTRLKVITAQENHTMTVGGVAGAMDKVAYNNKEGFAFNGFLSKFFPPEKDTNAQYYIEDLQKTFPEASFKETTGGTASKPTNTETIMLPTNEWHEAFYIAQKLFDIPSNFAFPNPKGRNSLTIENPKKPEHVLVSDLIVERKDNQLVKIKYSQEDKDYGSNVTITKEGELMKIEKKDFVN